MSPHKNFHVNKTFSAKPTVMREKNVPKVFWQLTSYPENILRISVKKVGTKLMAARIAEMQKLSDSELRKEAEEVLDTMIRYYEKGWQELKPDVLTFTNVIHCIAVSGSDDALERSLSIVRRMEDLHEQ